MVLDNNDEVWYDEAEEVDEAVDLDGTEFPLRLGKNLQGAPSPLSLLAQLWSLMKYAKVFPRACGAHGLTACDGKELPLCVLIISTEVTLMDAVLKLGHIEWMRPTYHTKKHIFPIGYSAVRAVELSATRGSTVQCLCEIGESANSFEPIFRYSNTFRRAMHSASSTFARMCVCK